jgi:NAD(P)-dependent dehydrogenase (short-subunit alcohol dehydrogenase family)
LSLSGSVVMVVGASRGIGRASAEMFAGAGAR